MVVTNILEYGEDMPHNPAYVMIPAHALMDLYRANREINGEHAVAHPIDGDAINRARCIDQHRRALDNSMTTQARIPWAQHQLEIDRLGATGQWVTINEQYEYEGAHGGPDFHSYRRWAEL